MTATGGYGFRVGKLQIQVLDGRTGQGKAGQGVTLKRWQADGNHVWAMAATTDAAGWIKVDPAEVGQIAYVVAAISPTDGQEKVSGQLWSGSHQFVLGSAALEARLRDGVSGVGLAGQWLTVWEKRTGGTLVERGKRKTDATGLALFDLDGLGSGRTYQLQGRPYLQAVNSGDLSTAGEHELKAGKLQVQVLDGGNGSAYAWSDVTLLERQPDGSLKGQGSFKTDGEGRLKLDPAQLGVRPYVLRAVSRLDGSLKESADYNGGGSRQFTVGGAGFTLRLIDHVSNGWLGGQDVEVLEKQADGTLVWRAKRTTDAEGLAKFDLDGLGSGKVYVFRAKPFGYWVTSGEVTATGGYGFRVGTTVLTISNAITPLANQIIVALEKLSNGSLRMERQAVTDAEGKTKFDLPGLGHGAVYLFRAVNPFGDGQDYYSELLTRLGSFSIALDKRDSNAPDRVPPQIGLLFPEQAAAVSTGGFSLYGSASDDVSIKTVKVYLSLPSGKVLERVASYRADVDTWHVDTGALGAEPAGTLGVRVVAVDSSLNEAEVRLDLSLLADQTAPVLAVNSHANGAAVPLGGFVVTGKVSDDTLSPSLSVRVSGGGLAADEVRVVEVAPASGNWAVRLAPETGFTTVPIDLTLTARDGAGNTTVKTLRLQPSDAFGQAWHVLRRTAFGAEPGQMAAVVGSGVTNYLWQQLHPEGVDDGEFVQRQQGWVDLGGHLATDYLRHAVYSRRQLQEVMTWFWENHFNTNYYKHLNPEYERQEMAGFRTHALGRFRDLLAVSAKSPAMLNSLDGVSNMKKRPNENYARELQELHTLGVSGGYTQQDVVAAARAFTGWTVIDGQFVFNADLHDNGEKVLLGATLPANGGLADGEAVLDLVARHPSTAKFVCGKLVTLLVRDVPVNSLIQQCAGVFVGTVDAPDQMAQVLWSILSSQTFLGTANRGSKLKTPLELTVGLVRNLDGETSGDDLALETQRMGMGLFVFPAPTGYPETGADWVSTSMLLNRVRFVDRALAAVPRGGSTLFHLTGLMQGDGLETAEGVVGRMLDLTLGPIWTRRHWELGMSLLTGEGGKPYYSWSPDAEQRLRSLGKALTVLPEYQYQ